jgi:glutaredoxin-dependent peroxiredoxin
MSLVGKSAPDFTLPNTSREAISLSALRGKKVVLAFFPAAFTGVCKKELCTFQESLAELNDANATVLAISVDSPFSNGVFAGQNGVSFDVLSDYSRSAVAAYGIELHDFAGMAGYTASKRAVFVVNEEGNVTYEWVGPNPGVEPDYAAVKAAL